jgi:hypothetical protein
METEVLVDANGGWGQAGIPLHSLNAAAIAKAGRQRPTNNALLCASICCLALGSIRFWTLLSEAISGTSQRDTQGGDGLPDCGNSVRHI